MLSAKKLLIVTAVVEVGVGALFILLPATANWLLVGVANPSPEALFVDRLGGAALVAIGAACWIARGDSDNASHYGLLWGMLIYNAGAFGVLVLAGLAMHLSGIALWPGAALHAGLLIWCVACLLTASRKNAA